MSTSHDVSSFDARLFPQTIQPITPDDVRILSAEISSSLAPMVKLERMTITITHFDSSLVVNIHETQFVNGELHFHFLHLMMSRYGLILFDLSQVGGDVMYRFYKRP